MKEAFYSCQMPGAAASSSLNRFRTHASRWRKNSCRLLLDLQCPNLPHNKNHFCHSLPRSSCSPKPKPAPSRNPATGSDRQAWLTVPVSRKGKLSIEVKWLDQEWQVQLKEWGQERLEDREPGRQCNKQDEVAQALPKFSCILQEHPSSNKQREESWESFRHFLSTFSRSWIAGTILQLMKHKWEMMTEI